MNKDNYNVQFVIIQIFKTVNVYYIKESAIEFPMNKLRKQKYVPLHVNKENVLCIEMEQHGLQIGSLSKSEPKGYC